MPSKYRMQPKKARTLLREELARTLTSCLLLEHSSPIMIQTLWQRWKDWDVNSTPRGDLRDAVEAAGVIWMERLNKEIAALTEIIEKAKNETTQTTCRPAK